VNRPRAYEFQSLSYTKDSPFKRYAAYSSAASLLPFPRAWQFTLTTLSLGRLAMLGAYLTIITSLLLSVDAPTSTPHFADDVAFRAAWITITQVPLVFFLSTKRGLLNIVCQISYDKINWLHRWVGRMIIVSATTHVAIMKSSISMSDILLSHDKGTTVVRYGISSYFLLVWIAVSSMLPLRRLSYRAFYLNHWVSTLGFLMVVLQHVPRHATTSIYIAFAFLAVDKILTLASFLKINISVRALKPRLAKFRRAPGRAMLITGYPIEILEPHNLSISSDIVESTTAIRICNVPMTWRPGQHIRLYLPALGAFETHPFTPANCSNVLSPPPLPPRGNQDVERRGSAACSVTTRPSNDMLLMIRAYKGLTRRLKEYHTEWLSLPCPNASISSTATSLTAYIDGPYGCPPNWENYEDLTLIATSTGVSFTLSIMDFLEQLCLSDASRLSTQRVRFVWIVRHIDPQLEASVAELLRRYSTMLRDAGVNIDSELYVTCSHSELRPNLTQFDQFAHLRPRLPRYGSGDRTLTIRNPDEIYDEWEEEERQWAEMEAMEELKMQELDPFVDAYEVSSNDSKDDNTAVTYEGEGYASSETSTLLEASRDGDNARQSNNFSDVRLTLDESAALNRERPLPSPLRTPLLPRDAPSRKNTCRCALIQYQRQKLQQSAKPCFDSTSYGTRPDITNFISSAVNSDPHNKSMVAVCANSEVSRQANKAVSKAKLAFARGQRATNVEIFTEGFS
jgi:hypothetical protein